MSYFNLPPHMYVAKEPDKPQGSNITYFEMVAAQMGDEVEWVEPLLLPRLIDYLKHEKEGAACEKGCE